MDLQRNEAGGLVWLTAPVLSAAHGFTTRPGGVSQGHLASLNLGENRGDDPGNVAENYRRLCHTLQLPLSRLVVSRQVHGCTVRHCTAEDVHVLGTPVPYEADGLLTDEPDLPLMIYTADCIPILLQDPIRGVVGAVHAGWRGTVQDIAGQAIRQMVSRYGCDPGHIRAAIGPGIGPCCFETGSEVPAAVQHVLGPAEAAPFLREHTAGKWMVDLKGVNRALLCRQGVDPLRIAVSSDCTMCDPELFWSHRHTDGHRGAQASVIMLKGTDVF